MRWHAVILNWNQAAATAAAVEALQSWRRPPDAVWIVDNASEDGSRDLLPRRCPAARLLPADTNLGFAGGNNLALRRLLDSDAEAALLLNNDAALPAEDGERLLEALASDPRLGAVGPLIEERRGERCLLTAGGRDIARHLDTRIPAGAAPEAAALGAVDYVPGTAALLRAAALRAVGLLGEAYFFGGEMADWCRRARDRGYRCAVCRGARATHAAADSPARDTLYRYYTLRNRFLYRRQWYRGPAGAALDAGWTVVGLAMAARALAAGRPAAARAAWLALRDGLGGRFGNRNAAFGWR